MTTLIADEISLLPSINQSYKTLFNSCLNKFLPFTFERFLRVCDRRSGQLIFFIFYYKERQRLSKIIVRAFENKQINIDPYHDFSYFQRRYANCIRATNKFKMLLFHHSFLLDKYSENSNIKKLKSGITIWSNKIENNLIQINLQLPEKTHQEGELLLVCSYNLITIFSMTFTICTGHHLSVPYETVLYVGGVQGEKNSKDKIRNFAKHNNEISPVALLVLATQALRVVFKLDIIVGISLKHHIVYDKIQGVENNIKSYDHLWESCGGTIIDNKFFILPISTKELPITCKNRTRARRRRHRKYEIKNEMLTTLQALF